jgi:catechol 2,3-dioxygenase-like lactoylglutathione lyase family enzyme
MAWAQPAAVTGLFHWIHSTADAERGIAFYRDVFGLELVNSPFGPPVPGATATPLRPRAEGASDPLIWDLTGTYGSKFRNAFMKLPGADFGHELSEFTGIEASQVRADFWQPGASMSIFYVTNFDATLAALKKAGGELVTHDGAPIKRANVRMLVARDLDGHLVEIIESTKAGAAVGLSVADLKATRRFYEDLLGFKIETPAGYTKNASGLYGMDRGEYRVSTTVVPGTSIRLEFYDFKGVPATPVRWRFQDPGAPQFQFRVRDLDSLIEKSKLAKVPFVSAGQKPIQRAFGRFVFVTDPDGVFVEYVHPSR